MAVENNSRETEEDITEQLQRAHRNACEIQVRMKIECLNTLVSNPKQAIAGLISHIITGNNHQSKNR